MAKPQSLAAQAGVLDSELKLPAEFTAPAEKVEGRAIAPYVTFAHPKRADEWDRLQNKFGNMSEGEMYLIESSDVHKLNPMKASLLCCKQFWAEVNAAGEVLRTSFEEQPKPFKEH